MYRLVRDEQRVSEIVTTEEPDYAFHIKSEVERHSEFPEMLVIHVTAEDEEYFEKPSAHLKALHITTLEDGFPGRDYFHLFDVESRDACDAYEVIYNNKQKIRNVLGTEHLFGDPEAYLVIEDISVDEECRGLGLALRLIREAMQVFGYWPSTMSILKAYPLDDESNDPTFDDIRSLANYYMSDKNLGFKEIDPINELGWLVALGDDPYYLTEEEAFFSGKPKGKSSG